MIAFEELQVNDHVIWRWPGCIGDRKPMRLHSGTIVGLATGDWIQVRENIWGWYSDDWICMNNLNICEKVIT